MELTREMLLERRRSLEADVIAINGAIQQVDWSLAQIDEEDETDIPLGLDDSCAEDE